MESPPIPLLIAIQTLEHRNDDVIEHLLEVGVVGVEQPLTVVIQSDLYEWPRIEEIRRHGDIKLPERLRDLFIFKCFELLVPQLDGTDIAELPIADATRWIQTQFLDDEAAILVEELRRKLTPGLVININNCSAFTRMPWPRQKGPNHE